MKWQTHTVTGSAHKSPREWNERVFAGCENILRHAPLQTLLLINLSALCFESNLVQPQERHSAVSGAWLCFEGRGLLPSQSKARLALWKHIILALNARLQLHTSHTPVQHGPEELPNQSQCARSASRTTARVSLRAFSLYANLMCTYICFSLPASLLSWCKVMPEK